MIVFRTSGNYYVEIKPVKAERVTAQMVVFKRLDGSDMKERKRGEYRNYHSTWKEAHDFIKSAACTNLANCIRLEQAAKDRIKRIDAMEEPL
jgi:hypothetical protein